VQLFDIKRHYRNRLSLHGLAKIAGYEKADDRYIDGVEQLEDTLNGAG
jgi:hypothetical protein